MNALGQRGWADEIFARYNVSVMGLKWGWDLCEGVLLYHVVRRLKHIVVFNVIL